MALFIFIFTFLSSPDIKEDFEWLIGTWQNTDQEAAFEEWWWNDDKGYYEGRGYRIVVGDTLVFEDLSIQMIEDVPHYIPVVQENDGAVPFKMTLWDNKGFDSENTKHDFPKGISYRNKGNRFDATISGNGKDITFGFKRVK